MNEFSTLKGGTELEVVKLDGTTETVLIKQHLIKDMGGFAAACGSPEKMLSFYTGKDDAWCNTLNQDSQSRILEEGDKLNSDFFTRQFKARNARLDMVQPGVSDLIKKQAESLLNGSPTLPVSPG